MNGSYYLEEIRKAAQCDAVQFHRREIFAGDLSFVTKEPFSDEELSAIELVWECYRNLDPSLVGDCCFCPERIARLLIALRIPWEEPDILQVRHSELRKLVFKLPGKRRNRQVYYFIRIYAELGSSGQLLYQYCDKPGMNFLDFAQAVDVSDEEAYDTACAFLEWSGFDIPAIVRRIADSVFRPARSREVAILRANGLTCKEAGESLHLSVTSVRVKEEDMRRRTFIFFELRFKVFLRISADCNGQKLIPVQKLEAYFGEYTSEFVYLLQSVLKEGGLHQCKTFAYDEYLEAFVVPGNVVPSDFIRSRVEKLPNILTVDEFQTIVTGMERELEIGLRPVKSILSQYYSLKGRFYVRNGSHVGVFYTDVVKRYFPDGIRLYRKGDIAEVRRHMLEDFGIDLSSMKDHTINGALRRVCTPCGPGLYRAP